MARKSIADFGEVSSNPIVQEDNKKDNKEDIKDNSVNDSIEDSKDFFDELKKGKKKEEKPVYTGFYADPDIAKILNKWAKKGGRGAKTKIINEALRMIFEQKGIK